MLKGLSPKEFAKYIYAMKSIKEEEVLDFQGSVEAAEQVREGREIGWKGRQERGGEEGDKGILQRCPNLGMFLYNKYSSQLVRERRRDRREAGGKEEDKGILQRCPN